MFSFLRCCGNSRVQCHFVVLMGKSIYLPFDLEVTPEKQKVLGKYVESHRQVILWIPRASSIEMPDGQTERYVSRPRSTQSMQQRASTSCLESRLINRKQKLPLSGRITIVLWLHYNFRYRPESLAWLIDRRCSTRKFRGEWFDGIFAQHFDSLVSFWQYFSCDKM